MTTLPPPLTPLETTLPEEPAAATASPRKDPVLYPTLDDDDLARLRDLSTEETFHDGDVVLKLGQADIDLLVVVDGAVDILNPTNDNALVVTHGRNSFIGDVDLLTRRPIVFTAIARGDGRGGPTRVLRVPGDKLRKVLNAVPRLSEKLIVAFQARRAALEAKGSLGVQVVGPGGCGATNMVREFLHKNFVPFVWHDSETDDGGAMMKRMNESDVGRAAIAERGPHGAMPAVDCGDGKVLYGPTLPDLASAAGVWRGCPDGEVDLAIVGGGPAGLAAAVYAASEGLSTVVLDKLGPGGQAGGSSKIENFIGFPSGLSGTELATRGVLQMLKFGAKMIAPVKVDRVIPAEKIGDCHQLHLDCGATIHARCILAATGVMWRRLTAPGAERFERAGVYYACTAVEADLHDSCDVAVIGGGNSAGQAVMFLAEQCKDRQVHHLVRRPLGAGMSDYLVDRIRGTANVVVHENVEVSRVLGKAHLDGVELEDCNTGGKTTLAVKAVFVFIGAEPHAEWLPDAVERNKDGYVLTGTDVVRAGKWPLKDRDPCPLETSVPGILAGGDLRAGSTKRVGFAVGDGSLAVTCVHSLRAR